MEKRRKDVSKLKKLVEILISGEELSEIHKDHALVGNWNSWRDCHIEPDWILIYKLEEGSLILGRTGTHSDLF